MTGQYKVVMFDFYGVLYSSLTLTMTKLELDYGLPKGFLVQLFMSSNPDTPASKLIQGSLTYTEFLPLFEKQVSTAAKSQGIQLPEAFNVKKFFNECFDYLKPNQLLLDAISNLQEAGYKICYLGNVGLIDDPAGNSYNRMKMYLQFTCDYSFESCHVGLARPNPKFYMHALEKMKVKPSEVISVEALEDLAKLACGVGMKGIAADDQQGVLKQLSELTGVDLHKLSRPVACRADNVTHCHFTTTSGVKLHYVEKGNGPAVILCHGFPEFWYSWRYQIPFLARLGYRAIALDQRGYGDSDKPPKVEDYCLEHLSQDVIDLMDTLNIPQAVLIGHDWGSAVVWNTTLHFPDRIKAVASLNLGYTPPHPQYNMLQIIQADPKQFDYMLYFQDEGVAEAEFEKDVERCLRFMYSDLRPKGPSAVSMAKTAGVRERGGLFVGLPDSLSNCTIMNDQELNCYVENFKKHGFRGPLNWYRNFPRNWKRDVSLGRYKIYRPALMVTAQNDAVLKPESTKGMEEYVPNLTRDNLQCGHWTQAECPAELNRVLSKWLPKVSPN